MLAFQVSLAAQRRWLASDTAAIAARSEGGDSLSKLEEEMEEARLYRQVRPKGGRFFFNRNKMRRYMRK